ncbi:MAG: hypothetical protein A2048_08285 [Deltaproteobacteria bacterium GWA2_45_12]|nr:MAG: hypothetical protein A2048_08285 [Deltaproteobacteria bacterium GWA2_45_12]
MPQVSKILVVDDSGLARQMMGDELLQAGFEVVYAKDGLEAIHSAFTQMPDLIVLDINMPRINGYQVCRLLKDHPGTSHIPILIETSKAATQAVDDPRSWSFETGADAFMDKSETSDIVGLVQKLLKKNLLAKAKYVPLSPMPDIEVMMALSTLLDKQLYQDVTRLKNLSDKKSSFVANVSHELKSPMAVIKGSLQNMKLGLLGPVSEKQLKSINLAIGTVDRLSRMIRDLLDVAKMEAGKLELNKSVFDLEELVSELMELYLPSSVEKKINLSCQCEQGLNLTADRDRILQVLANLVSNSIKFTPEGGAVILQACKKGSYLLIKIMDTGHGIDPENIGSIFDKFKRLDGEKEEGTGLGLAIARDLVALHGGDIWVESELGKGATFFVELPL